MSTMTQKRIVKNTVLFIDMRLFHSEIIYHIRKNAMYSFSCITEKDIVSLIDPILSFLFYQRNNFHVYGNGKYTHIFLFYTLEDFIEQYDDLFIDFNNFFYFHGISQYKKYDIVRKDNFRTFIIEK